MPAEPLTKAEEAWLTKLQKVLDECPSDRMEAYTIGDPDLVIFDNKYSEQINERIAGGRSDFGPASEQLGANIYCLKMPFPVHSTSG